MKKFLLFLTITSSITLSCGSTIKAPDAPQSVQSDAQNLEKITTIEDMRTEDVNSLIASGNILLLCQKALKFAPQNAVLSLEECQKKMNVLLERKEQILFAEMAKCVSEANDQTAMKLCNSPGNPRYQNLK